MKLRIYSSSGPIAGPTVLSVARNGQHTLSSAAVTALSAAVGDNATICFDEEGNQWLLAHWPGGKKGWPKLSVPGHHRQQLRMGCGSIVNDIFAGRSESETSLQFLIASAKPFTDSQLPDAKLYTLSFLKSVGRSRSIKDK